MSRRSASLRGHEPPGRPPLCCWPASGMTWWSWTRRHSRGHRVDACGRSSGVVQLLRWGLLICLVSVPRPSGRSPPCGGESGPTRSGTGPGLTWSWRPAGTCWTRSSRLPRNGRRLRAPGCHRDRRAARHGYGRVTGIYAARRRLVFAVDLGGRYVIGAMAVRRGSPLGRGRRDQPGPPRGLCRPVRHDVVFRGLAWSSTWPSGRSPGCSHDDGRRASGSALPPLTPRRPAAGPGRARSERPRAFSRSRAAAAPRPRLAGAATPRRQGIAGLGAARRCR